MFKLQHYFVWLFMALLVVGGIGLSQSVSEVEAQSQTYRLDRLPFDSSAGAIYASRTSRAYQNEYNALGLGQYYRDVQEYHSPSTEVFPNRPAFTRGAIDFAGSFPVVAAKGGTVISAGNGFNCDVAIRHLDGTIAYYLHMRNITVNIGDTVQSGTPLGTASDCGNANGNHLHFSVFGVSGELELRFQGVSETLDSVGSGLVCSAELICPTRGGVVGFAYSGTPIVSTPLYTRPEFDFSTGLNGWRGARDLFDTKELDNAMWAAVQDTDNSGHLDPFFISPELAPFEAADYTHVRIRMGRQIDAPCAEFFWAGPGQSFSGDRRVIFTPNNSNEVRETYEIPLTAADGWGGIVNRLRFDPSCQHQNDSGGFVSINSIELIHREEGTAPTLTWDYSLGVTQGWTPENNLGGVKSLHGGMWAAIRGNNPQFFSPMFAQPINAADYAELRVTMGRQADTCADFHWRFEGDGQTFTGAQIAQLNPEPVSSDTYIIDLTQIPTWTGQIDRLRFDPACNTVPNNSNYAVRIDSISLVPATQAVSDDFYLSFSPPSSTIGVGETTTLTLNAVNPLAMDGIRGLDVACEADTAIMDNLVVATGTFFSGQAIASQVPGVVSPNFQWIASETSEQPSVTADGAVLTATYTGDLEGTTELLCTVSAIDDMGALITEVDVLPATITVIGDGEISGFAQLSESDDHAGILIELLDDAGTVIVSTITDAEGTFTMDAAPGTYEVRATAPGYLSMLYTDLQVDGSSIAVVSPSVMIPGDINQDDVVDLLDITQFSSDYVTLQETPELVADFNRDDAVNLLDFYTMVNFLDATGPSEWGISPEE